MPPRITQINLPPANVDDLERLFRALLPLGQVTITFMDDGVSFEVKTGKDTYSWSQFLSLDDFFEMYYKKYPEDKEEHSKTVLPVPDALRRNI